jgi:hypothetical protein
VRKPGRGHGAVSVPCQRPSPPPWPDCGIRAPVSAVRRRWGGLRNELDRSPAEMEGVRHAARRPSSALTLARGTASPATPVGGEDRSVPGSLAVPDMAQGPLGRVNGSERALSGVRSQGLDGAAVLPLLGLIWWLGAGEAVALDGPDRGNARVA